MLKIGRLAAAGLEGMPLAACSFRNGLLAEGSSSAHLDAKAWSVYVSHEFAVRGGEILPASISALCNNFDVRKEAYDSR